MGQFTEPTSECQWAQKFIQIRILISTKIHPFETSMATAILSKVNQIHFQGQGVFSSPTTEIALRSKLKLFKLQTHSLKTQRCPITENVASFECASEKCCVIPFDE